MPHKIFVSDLKEGSFIESIFLVKLKSLQHAKNGKPYLNVILHDKSGEIVCRIWDEATDFDEKFNKDDFVYVKARVTKYQDKNQLTIKDIQRINEDLVNLSDFQKTAENDLNQMQIALKSAISSVENKFLNKLLNKIFSEKSIMEKYTSSPAAKTVHHAYIGGLIEHSLNLANVASALRPFYKMIDFDLVITAILLHDIGKIKELNFSKNFDYTDEGKLIGHIVLGEELVNSYMKQIEDFPMSLSLKLRHIILSHHGCLEYGSPKRPKTLEAVMVSFIDDMDSKIHGINEFAKNDHALKNSNWTSYNKFYDRFFYFPKPNEEKDKVQIDTQNQSIGNLFPDDVKQKLKAQLEDEKSEEKKEKDNLELFDF